MRDIQTTLMGNVTADPTEHRQEDGSTSVKLRIAVTGRLNTSEWQGTDGVTRYSLNLQAESIGHDLTYGSSQFTKPLRAQDVPNVDPNSGEILTEASSANPEDADETEGENSLAPAF